MNAVKTLNYLGGSIFAYVLGYAYAKSGDEENAKRILEHVMREGNTAIMSNRLAIASIFIGLGEFDKAFKVLEVAY